MTNSILEKWLGDSAAPIAIRYFGVALSFSVHLLIGIFAGIDEYVNFAVIWSLIYILSRSLYAGLKLSLLQLSAAQRESSHAPLDIFRGYFVRVFILILPIIIASTVYQLTNPTASNFLLIFLSSALFGAFDLYRSHQYYCGERVSSTIWLSVIPPVLNLFAVFALSLLNIGDFVTIAILSTTLLLSASIVLDRDKFRIVELIKLKGWRISLAGIGGWRGWSYEAIPYMPAHILNIVAGSVLSANSAAAFYASWRVASTTEQIQTPLLIRFTQSGVQFRKKTFALSSALISILLVIASIIYMEIIQLDSLEYVGVSIMFVMPYALRMYMIPTESDLIKSGRIAGMWKVDALSLVAVLFMMALSWIDLITTIYQIAFLFLIVKLLPSFWLILVRSRR